MSKEDFEKAMAELDIAAVKNRKYEKMADTIRAHVAELETMVQGHKLAADAAMGLAGDLKAKLAEVEQESIRRGDLIADKAFKLVDVRKERDALRQRIEGAEKHLREAYYQFVHAVPVSGGGEECDGCDSLKEIAAHCGELCPKCQEPAERKEEHE